jgi:DNA modification methylase
LSQPALTLLTGDAQKALAALPAGSVQTCITSPPYFGLRDYGAKGQVGLEATPAAYVARLVAVFCEVRRVLRDDGTCWINLGDSYAGSNMTGGNNGINASGGPDGYKIKRQFKRPSALGNLTTKQLLGIPWRVAFALQADGWVLRSDVIWAKPNPMPESVRDRPTKSHEYLFLLSKQPRYYYDAEAIKEPAAFTETRRRGSPNRLVTNGTVTFQGQRLRNGLGDTGLRCPSVAGRNRRTVWTVATAPLREAHFAAFPPKLIEPCVLAGSRKGDLVLDPFSGAATTGLVALQHGRRYIGIDLNARYHEIARRRLAAAGLLTQPEPRTRRLAA